MLWRSVVPPAHSARNVCRQGLSVPAGDSYTAHMTLPLSDTAGMTGRTNRPTVPSESRQMRDFQDFLRASRRYLDGPLVAAISAEYDRLYGH